MAIKPPVRKLALKLAPKKPASTSLAGKKKPLGIKTKATTGAKAAPIVRGAKGFQVGAQKRQEQDAYYEKQRMTPYRFRLKKGEEADLVILDAGEPFFVSEHVIKHNGKYINEVCIADSGCDCPLCESEGKSGSYTLMLTVLDRRPYKVTKGPNAGKVIKVSKKLLPVKGRNLDKFSRNFEKFKQNFRGVQITCRRATDTEASIGEDIEFSPTRIPEAVLKKYKDLADPAPYEEIFEVPDADELRKRYGLGKGGKRAGSADFGDDNDDDDDLDGVKGW